MPRKIFSKESLGVTDQLPRRPIQSGSTNGSRQTAGKPTDETNYEDLQRPHNYSEMRNRYFPSRPATGEFGTRFNTYFNPPAPRDIYESSTKLNRQGPEIPHGPDQTLAQTEEIPFSGKNMLDAEKHVETRTQGKFSDSSSRGLNGYAARNTQGSSQAALEPRESPRSERFTRAVGHGDVVTQCHASGIMLSPERSMTSSQSSPLIYPMQLEDNRNVHVPSLWSQQPTLSPQHSLQADSRALVAAPLNRRPVSRRRIPEKRPPTRISTRVAERSALQRGFEQGRALAQVSPNTAAMSGPSQSKKRKAESCIEEINRPPRKSSIQYPGMRDSAERLELEQSKSSTSSKSHSKKTKAPCVETSEPCQRIQAAESTIRPVPEPPKRSTNGKFVTKKSEDRRRPKTAAGTATAPEETQAQIPSDQHRPTTAAGTATVPHESTIGSESMAAAPISSGTPRSTIVTLKVPSIALESIANPTATPTSSARISPLSTLLTPTNDKILDLVNAQLKEVLSPVLSALQQVVDRL
ncbi:MAG: hypothetical protein M4579_003953 [Chaenotheca gracillima]|nr:MAG: hypothetical protein M4579_003953 [Chaenotheca gracillima]